MNNFNAPAIVLTGLLSALLSALAMSLARDDELPTSGLVSATAVVAVGWWINSAVRRRGELDRISIDYLSDLNRRVDELISTCLSTATTPTNRLVSLTCLSNELHWLGVIAKKQNLEEHLANELILRFTNFKRPLTGYPSVDWGRASDASHKLRMTALKSQWDISQHVLSRKNNTNIFASS